MQDTADERIIESIENNLPNNSAVQSNALIDIFPYKLIDNGDIDAHEYYPYGPRNDISNVNIQEHGLFSDIIRGIHFLPFDSSFYKLLCQPNSMTNHWMRRVLLILVPRLNLANSYWTESVHMPIISMRKGTRIAADAITCASMFVEFKLSEISRYELFIEELVDKVNGLNDRLKALINMLIRRDPTYIYETDHVDDSYYSFLKGEVFREIDFRSFYKNFRDGDDLITVRILKLMIKVNRQYVRMLGFYGSTQVKNARNVSESKHIGKDTLNGFYSTMYLSKFPSQKLFKGLPKTTTAELMLRKYHMRTCARISTFRRELGEPDSAITLADVTLNDPTTHEKPHPNDSREEEFFVRDFSFFYRNKRRLVDDTLVTVEMPAPIDFPSMMELFFKSGMRYGEFGAPDEGFWVLSVNGITQFEEFAVYMQDFLKAHLEYTKPAFAYSYIQV